DTEFSLLVEMGSELLGLSPDTHDRNATLYYSSLDKSEESANEIDDADESDMDLSNDNSHADVAARLLKEFTASGTSKKVLVREEARHLITKNVNDISLVKMEKEKNTRNNKVVDKNIIELSELNAIEPEEAIAIKKETRNITNNEEIKGVKEEITGEGIEELVEMPRS
nr:hypothetical protein [Tanacetum cinerariifolium]